MRTIQETHTGNDSVDERTATTTWTVHDNVLLVCGLQGGDNKRWPVDANGPDHNNVDIHDVPFVWRPQTNKLGRKAARHRTRTDAYGLD